MGCIDSANVYGRAFLLRIGAASHGDGATSLHIQYAAFLQINTQWNVTYNLERLYIAVFVTIDGNIGGICVHKLLHICNIICSGQIVHGNRYWLTIESTYALCGGQVYILAKDTGFPICLIAVTTVLIHQLFSDGVEHHFLCPLKGWIICLIDQRLIGVILRQIFLCIGVLGILVGGGLFKIGTRGVVLRVSNIVLITVFCQLLRLLRVSKACVSTCACFVVLVIG